MKKRQDVRQKHVVSRNVVELLLRLGIWIPVEVLPMNHRGEPIISLKKRSDALIHSQQTYWKYVGQIPAIGTRPANEIWAISAKVNRGIVSNLLTSLHVWKLPVSIHPGSVENNDNWQAHPTATETGLAFTTWYYNSNKDLCRNFFQVLQDQKLCSEGAKRWHFAKVTVAPGKHHFKLLVIHDWVFENNSYYEKKDEGDLR